jgi:hypothetical protein
VLRELFCASGVNRFSFYLLWSEAVARRTFPDPELDASAILALEQARSLPPGPERTEALKRAGQLRNAADSYRRVFASEAPNADQS